jgi:hypothetical protein
MESWICMTGHTLSRKIRELTSSMASFAQNIDMCTGQGEIALIMVERHCFPILWGMTGSTVRAKATVVLIILSMAGKAISGCTLERVILMTFFTSHPCMFPLQLESRQVMVKRCTFPAIGSMACITSCAKT